MSVETEFYAACIADGAISAITTRVRPLTASQDEAFPFVVYTVTSDDKTKHAHGQCVGGEMNLSIQCYAETYAEAIALDAAVAALFAPDSSYPKYLGSTWIKETDIGSPRDSVMVLKDRNDDKVYQRSREITFWWG